MNAPRPTFTSRTSASIPSASFLLRMLEAISGIDSTVAVASRSAYSLRSAGAIRAVWPIRHTPSRSTSSMNALHRQVDAEAGDALQLVEGAAGVAEAAARHHRHPDAAHRRERRERERDLVADAAGRVLVDLPPAIRERSSTSPECSIASSQCGSSVLQVQPAEEDGHEESGELLVGDLAAGRAAHDERELLGVSAPPSRFLRIRS